MRPISERKVTPRFKIKESGLDILPNAESISSDYVVKLSPFCPKPLSGSAPCTQRAAQTEVKAQDSLKKRPISEPCNELP
jgi:hypothetical protein